MMPNNGTANKISRPEMTVVHASQEHLFSRDVGEIKGSDHFPIITEIKDILARNKTQLELQERRLQSIRR